MTKAALVPGWHASAGEERNAFHVEHSQNGN